MTDMPERLARRFHELDELSRLQAENERLRARDFRGCDTCELHPILQEAEARIRELETDIGLREIAIEQANERTQQADERIRKLESGQRDLLVRYGDFVASHIYGDAAVLPDEWPDKFLEEQKDG